ncbi:4700_t:CDS:1 [Racocetra fulgida]|uniref:4700_t:CDS:1 n=1 Tax=Racocetra fulgida TaxID=60492 RepID=A0A9N9CJG9_9GLOM|nr:4700_t:CDS:1 [Racocetra fulgida]
MQELSEELLITSDNEIRSSTLNSPLVEPNEINETTNDDAIDDAEDGWSRTIENWIGMLNTENHLDNRGTVSNEPLEFEIYGHTTYPAEDSLAKWNLSELFDDLLEPPISFVFQ